MEQRLLVMRTIGCPEIDTPDGKRPSVKASGNTQRQYERYMELAEMSARMEGRAEQFPTPRNYVSWYEAMESQRSREAGFIERIFDEARAKLPEQFTADALRGFVGRMTKNDAHPIGFPTTSLAECSCAQLYAIAEGAKAWIGREFWKRDMEPKRFTIPAHVRRRLEQGRQVA